ncbi:MAG: 1-deoxy-D-xylulose-5-phosphate reductoisomerase [Pseudomonadota bacterium]
MKTVTLLGATGSIGRSAVDLLRRAPDRFAVEAVVGGSNAAALAETAIAVKARFAAVADDASGDALRDALAGTGIASGAGSAAVEEAADRPADLVLSAIVGAAGLRPTLAAARRGADIALANKEALVCAGDLLTAEIADGGGALLPVDSEHNAIFQVFDAGRRETVEKLILTASGGPFRDADDAAIAAATPAQAVAHPNWSMGAKISVDSATMMNKGLELIEASRLFGFTEDRVDIVVHPQSIVHSLVAYCDGSVLAQLGQPDMRTPIAYALAWPERMTTPCEKLDLAAIGRLDFQPPDARRFPALRLARAACAAGGDAPIVFNAANEVAVAAFLVEAIGFLDIAACVEDGLARRRGEPITDIDGVFDADAHARAQAAAWVRRRAGELH